MKDEQDSLETRVMGIPIKAKGINAVVVALLAVTLAAMSFLLWDRTNKTDEYVAHQSQIWTHEHDGIVNAIKAVQGVNEKLAELIDEQNFIVLSDEAERKEMKKQIRRPPSLSRKLER